MLVLNKNIVFGAPWKKCKTVCVCKSTRGFERFFCFPLPSKDNFLSESQVIGFKPLLYGPY